jgi:hypothetical protein
MIVRGEISRIFNAAEQCRAAKAISHAIRSVTHRLRGVPLVAKFCNGVGRLPFAEQ